MPFNEAEETWGHCLSRCASLRFRFRVGNKSGPWIRHAINDEDGYGLGYFFDRPWKEVVHEGSPYFPGGQMTIVVQTRF